MPFSVLHVALSLPLALAHVRGRDDHAKALEPVFPRQQLRLYARQSR